MNMRDYSTLHLDTGLYQNSDISKLINWKVYIKIATVAITGKLKKNMVKC